MFRWTSLFLFTLGILFHAHSDGGYVSKKSAAVSADQKAILVRIGDEISITYSTGYTGNGEDFGWIIPVPKVPDIDGVFEAGREGEWLFDFLEEETIPWQRNSSGGCFPGGTPVHTRSGLKPIESIEVGEEIWSYDWNISSWVLSPVSAVHRHDYKGDLVDLEIDGEYLSATGNHPFFVLHGDALNSRPVPVDLPAGESVEQRHGRWVEARQLQGGDRLITRDGTDAVVNRMSSGRSRQVVYNLTMDGPSNYAVFNRGFLVHNKGGADEAGSGVSGVSVHGQVTLEHYEVSILGAGSGTALLDWLNENGYRVETSARSILDDYIFRGWSFVAVRLVPGEIRAYENEFLPPITIRYRDDELIFPLRISAISSEEPVRITLFVIADGTVVSVNYPTKELLYHLKHRENPSRTLTSEYLDELISGTIGDGSRGIVILWAGYFPDHYNEELKSLGIDTGSVGQLHLTRLESFIEPSRMTDDIYLVKEKYARQFSVIFPEDPMEAVADILLIVYLSLILVRLALMVLSLLATLTASLPSTIPKDSDVKIAMLFHFSGLMGFLGPVLVKGLRKEDSYLVRMHSCLSLRFQVSIFLYASVILIIGLISLESEPNMTFMWFGLNSLFIVYRLVMPVVAMLRTRKGRKVFYPLSLPSSECREEKVIDESSD